MKRFLQMFALMALLLTGSVTMEAGKVLTYDFMTNHPSTTIRIDQGYMKVKGSFAYWTGEWAGLFGNKIAFDATSAYASLRAEGGLCDYHDHQKMYVMNLNAGDKVTFNYTGTGAVLQYHVSSTAVMSELTEHFDPITSGTPYTVIAGGNLCVINRWRMNEAETIITSIVINTAKEYEEVDFMNGMCTFCSTVPLDFSITQQVKAFVATGYDHGKFIFKQVKYVPSNTGFLVVSQGGSSTTARIPVGRSSNHQENAISDNLFNGSLEAVSIIPQAGKKYYILAVAEGEVGIFRMNSSFRCQAKKAYLMVDN